MKRFWVMTAAVLITSALCLTGWIFTQPKPSLTGNIPFSKAVFDQQGRLLRLTLAADQRYRLPVPLESISNDLIEATLQQEDRYFFYHPGVNPFAILRGAYTTYVTKSRPVGGSTLTMQLVRMRDTINTRSVQGKLTQMLRALILEAHYSKRDILEAYLNLAPYGGNIHGAATASLIYYHQPAKTLPMAQSLGLAVIPQNPVKRNPLRADNNPWQQARLKLFHQFPAQRFEQYADLMTLPLTAYPRERIRYRAPHFVNQVLNSTPTTSLSDHQIESTLKGNQQQLIERKLHQYVTRHASQGFDNAAAILVHVPSMEVRALVGSVNFFNASISGQVDGTQALRSPGSTLKPLIYALALEQGLIHPNSLLQDDRTLIAEYRPGNYDKHFMGSVTATEALQLSRNIPAITLARQLNPSIYDFLQDVGADFPFTYNHYGLALVVGGAEVSMQRLAAWYAMLAQGGVLRPLRFVKNRPIDTGEKKLSAEAALLTLKMLQRPKPNQVAYATPSSLPVYWKTGTSNGFRDAWTAGIVGDYALVVWLGHFDGHPNSNLIGAKAAAPLFFDIVQGLHTQLSLKDAVAPALAQANIRTVALCSTTGNPGSCTENNATSTEGYFIPGVSPIKRTVNVSTRRPLTILSPREHITYTAQDYSHNQAQHQPNTLAIPLEARIERGKHQDKNPTLFWFVENVFLGSTSSGSLTSNKPKTLFWYPKPGTYQIRVIDKYGNGDQRTVRIMRR